MKTKLILALATMLLFVTGMRAATPYAVFCEDQSLHFLTANTKPTGNLNGKKITYVYDVNLIQESENQESDDPGWYIYSESIKTVIFDVSFEGVRPTSCYKWFCECSELTAIEGLVYLNTSEVTNMEKMFYGCSIMEELDLSSFNTSSVTDMSYMFYKCSGLTSLDLSSFDTSSVTDMSDMFNKCSGLTSLDLSNFDTANVTNMSSMFDNCSGLTSLDLSSFNTSNVTNMSHMFYGCSSLTSLDLSNFDTANVTNMSSMFSGCSGLTSLNLSNFDTANVTYMSSMFSGCSGLTSLNLSNFDTANVTNMSSMFSGCSGLPSLDLSSFNTSKVESMDGMFRDCSGLEIIYVSDKFSTQDVTMSLSMFMRCTKLRNFSSSNADDITYANYGADGYFSYLGPYVVFDSDSKKLTFKNGKPADDAFYILNQGSDTPGWNSISAQIEKVVFDESFKDIRPSSCYEWFNGCTNLTSFEGLGNLNTSEVTTMESMFNGCSNLTTLYLTNINFSSLGNYDDMFFECNNLRLVDLYEAVDCSIIASLIPQNALVFVPADTEVSANRENVVVGETCANFVINYGTTENNQNLLKIPYGFTANKVTINRKFEQDTPYSLYLPFGMSTNEHGTFYAYAGRNGTSVQFDPITDTATSAHTPYMFIPTDDYYANGIVIENVTVDITPENAGTETDGYIGVYEKKIFTEEDEASGVYYGWAGTGFYRAGACASVDACRAYFKLPSTATFNAPERMDAKFGDNGLTNISDINSDDAPTDSPSYNLNGQRVNNNYRGIVIKEGKKIINPAR